MEKKLLLIIKEGIVVYARLFDSVWIEKTTSTFPYRSNDAPGNPYARALRLRDHNIARGTDVEVLVLDEDDIEKYYYKRYNSATQEFYINNETEKERQERIDMIDAFFGLDQEGYDGIEYMKPTYDIYKDYVTEKLYDNLRSRVRKHELFSEEETEAVLRALDVMTQDKRDRAIYTIASHYSRVCIDPIVGKLPVDRDQEHIQATKDIAIEWWDKLIGTQHEKKALAEKARIYSWSCEESRAVDIYNSMLNRSDVKQDEKISIKKKIKTLGSGREILDEAQSLYDFGDYEGCISKLDECDSKSSGAVKQFLKQSINKLRGLCLVEDAKTKENTIEKNYLVEEASRLIYPERYLGDSKLREWERDLKAKKDNISDRDYLNAAE